MLPALPRFIGFFFLLLSRPVLFVSLFLSADTASVVKQQLVIQLKLFGVVRTIFVATYVVVRSVLYAFFVLGY